MTRRASLFAAVVLSFAFAFPALAHEASVQQKVGNMTVSFNQDPLSPLVGETVGMIFTLKSEAGQPVNNLDVTVSITDTAVGQDASPVLTRTLTTDEHGVVESPYAFTIASTFDVELAYRNPDSGAEQDTGFLVQVRQPEAAATSSAAKTESRKAFWLGLLAGLILGWSVARRQEKKA